MESDDWKQFAMTGQVEDYLFYRAKSRKRESGAENCESDGIDRDGAVYSADWRI